MKRTSKFALLSMIVMMLCIIVVSAQAETLKVGDTINFGTYDDGEHGKDTPVEWHVLKTEDDRVLLLSEKALFTGGFDGEGGSYESITDSDLSWANCSLRDYLNGEFLDEAFSDTEKESILLTKVSTEDAFGKTESEDRVFILSYAEAEELLDNESLIAYATKRAAKDVRDDSNGIDQKGRATWWLRDLMSSASSGKNGLNMAYTVIQDYPLSRERTCPVSSDNIASVRPAIWVSMDGLNQTKQSEEETQEMKNSGASTPELKTWEDVLNEMKSRFQSSYYGESTRLGDSGDLYAQDGIVILYTPGDNNIILLLQPAEKPSSMYSCYFLHSDEALWNDVLDLVRLSICEYQPGKCISDENLVFLWVGDPDKNFIYTEGDRDRYTNMADCVESDPDLFIARLKKIYAPGFLSEEEQELLASQRETLKKGSKGEDVKKLQKRLNELGYDVGKPDGSFGNKTAKAVEDFQNANGLPTNGEVDGKTWTMIFDEKSDADTTQQEGALPLEGDGWTVSDDGALGLKISGMDKYDNLYIFHTTLRVMQTGKETAKDFGFVCDPDQYSDDRTLSDEQITSFTSSGNKYTFKVLFDMWKNGKNIGIKEERSFGIDLTKE